MKIDLKSGFHQIPLHQQFKDHNGICYRGQKLSLTRLPMGHALAPSLFQRFATACLEEVRLATKVEGVAYLDDRLLFDRDPQELRRAVGLVRTLGSLSMRTSRSYFPHTS